MSESFTASNGWRLDDAGCLRSPNDTRYASSSVRLRKLSNTLAEYDKEAADDE